MYMIFYKNLLFTELQYPVSSQTVATTGYKFLEYSTTQYENVLV